MLTIIVTIIVGAIVGFLARAVLPGRQTISTLVTVILGILGSLAGSAIWVYALGKGDTKGIDWIALILGVICAAIFIVIYGAATGRKQV
jgi:uncharacterized membrane protein YeaQ/YmgE (transglycosylase-associated protein family)